MKVYQSYCVRNVTAGKNHHWGNDSVEEMLKDFPKLTPLVLALQTEDKWSKSHQGGGEWTALFFVDFVDSCTTKITLEIKPSRKTLKVPVLSLDLDTLPTIQEVEYHILANIRRSG